MDPTRLHGMILAPEPGDAGASGGGAVPAPGVTQAASPAPSSTPSNPTPPPAPRVPYVPPPGDGPAPAPASGQPGSAPAAGAPGGAQPAATDNPIPHARVQQMLRQQEQRLRSEFQQAMQGVSPKPRDVNQTLDVVRQALKLAGIEVPDAPQEAPLTRAELMQALQAQDQRYTEQFAIRSDVERGRADMASAKTQFAEHFAADPNLEARCIALWGQDREGRSLGEIVKEQVGVLDAYLSARNQQYAQRKGQDQGVAPIRPGPGGAPARPQHDLATNAGQDAALDELLDGMG